MCLSLLHGSQAQAAWAPVPVPDLAHEADLIAVAKVLRTDEESTRATATLEIQSLLKAPPHNSSLRQIRVRYPSPVVPPGTTRFVLAEDVFYGVGERVVVFLKAVPDSGDFETLRGVLGKISVTDGRVEGYGLSLEDFVEEIRAAVK